MLSRVQNNILEMGGHDEHSIPKLVGHLDKLVGHWCKLLEGAIDCADQLLLHCTQGGNMKPQFQLITISLHVHICTLNYSHMASYFS